MAIAGYNPDAAVPFWERIASLGGGGTPELLSTHPSDATRIKDLQAIAPEAKRIAGTFGVRF
jgi:predicted Zn-dependent protease